MENGKNNMMMWILGLLVIGGLGFYLFSSSSNDESAMMDSEQAMDGESVDSMEKDESMMEGDSMVKDDAMMQSQNIVELASSNDDFSTLVTAVDAAGLVDVLSGEGPYTVFAPTNAAFDALPAGTLDSLLADPAALADVLTYHVVEGKVMAEDVVNLTSATTVQGSDVTIEVVDGNVRVNEAMVVTTDLEASNGVIHVIDAVLLPPQ